MKKLELLNENIGIPISPLQLFFRTNQIVHYVTLSELPEDHASLHSYLLAGSRLDLTFISSCSLSELLASSSPSSSSFESSFQVFLLTQKCHKFHLLVLEIALAKLSCCERSLVG